MTTDRMYKDKVFKKGEKLKPFRPGPTDGLIKVWAYSTLMDFERCPMAVRLAKVDKIKVDNSDNKALVRGNEIHQIAEDYTTGKTASDEVPAELKKFEKDFIALREAYAQGDVSVEENWGVKLDWSPCTWQDDDLWGRIKLDAFHMESEFSAKCIDHKTGRKFGNELKHALQGMFYTLTAFYKYPKLQFIQTEFWYLDKGEKLIKEYTRTDMEVLKERLTNRAIAMTSCTDFPARPSQKNCKWCDFNKSGDCQFAEK